MKSRPTLELVWIAGRYAICRLAADAPAPPLDPARFLAVTRTGEELSVVCADESVPPGATAQGPYALFRVAGGLPLGLTGILASLLEPLAAAAIPIFAISTFDTDYVLVRVEDRERAAATLTAAGHRFAAGAA